MSHQALLFLPLKCIFMFSFLIQFTHYCQTIVSKISLGSCHLSTQNLSGLSIVTGSRVDTRPCLTLNYVGLQFTSKTTCSGQGRPITDLTLHVAPSLETFLGAFPEADVPPETPFFSPPPTSIQCGWSTGPGAHSPGSAISQLCNLGLGFRLSLPQFQNIINIYMIFMTIQWELMYTKLYSAWNTVSTC